MAFVTRISTTTTDKDSVLVIVGRLSKKAVFIASKKTIMATKVVRMHFDHVFSILAVPKEIILDKAKLFK